MHVLQREFWNGPPERLPDAFRMTKQKGDRVLSAVCETWSHPFGWELRLEIDGHGPADVLRRTVGRGNARDG
jgi:hypothetical protein